MKIFLWIAASFFLILFGFIVGIFLAPLLAYLTGFPVFVIPVIIGGLSLIAFIVLHFAYARRATQKSSFYYPCLCVPIFLCSGLLAIHSGIKYKLVTYDSHGKIERNGTHYNSFGVKLFEKNDDMWAFYAYNEHGDVFICRFCDTYRYDRGVQYKIYMYNIYTLDGTLVKSGEIDSDKSKNIEKDIAKSMNLIPEYL